MVSNDNKATNIRGPRWSNSGRTRSTETATAATDSRDHALAVYSWMSYSAPALDVSLVVDCLKLAENTADLLTKRRRRCLDFAANLMKAPQNNKFGINVARLHEHTPVTPFIAIRYVRIDKISSRSNRLLCTRVVISVNETVQSPIPNLLVRRIDDFDGLVASKLM
uniref:Uncharacterized protein n=1 Tax=Daphnia galeata TaxID=27404 RepID=A0A8J2RSU9_9CRUS|nr:unnamed protein product [Daphnia galeata]